MADIAYGASLAIYNGSTFDDVANVISFDEPQYQRDAVETTHMLSADQFREYIPGMMDGGEVNFGINYTPAASNALRTALTASTLQRFKITHKSGIYVDFYGVPTALTPATPIDDRMTAAMTIKVSGKPVWG